MFGASCERACVSGVGSVMESCLAHRFRYHHDANDAGIGPRIDANHIRNPVGGGFSNDNDRKDVM